MSIDRICLYTTVYPKAKAYLHDWHQSVRRQTDRDFQVWIGLDAMSIEEVVEEVGGDLNAIWVCAEPGDTPAQVRQRALAQIVDHCDGVILVDSDDILHETRVAAARADLQRGDLVGCALNLVTQTGEPMRMTIGLPPLASADGVLPRHNIFGLSNSAFRTDLLRRCLPIPQEVILVDWFLATRAWLCGARLIFDHIPRMDYRQHEQNMTQVRPPFTEVQIERDTCRVLRHMAMMKEHAGRGGDMDRSQLLVDVERDIQVFYDRIILRPRMLEAYRTSLNVLEPAPVWWASVAHPSLRNMWT
jgi:hypothetical protein